MADPVPLPGAPNAPSGPDPSVRAREAAYRIAEAALATTDLDQLYASVHEIVRGLMPADDFYIALHDRDQGLVSFPYWVDQMEPVQPTRTFDRGLTEYVLRTGTPQLVDEVRLASLRLAGEVDRVGPEALAWLGVPLAGSGGTFGVLVVQSYAGGHPYGPAERDLLTFVSGQVAMAIERKRVETTHRLTRVAIDHARDSVFGMQEDGRLIFVNQAACDGLRYTRNELLALRIMDIDPSLDETAWARIWQEGHRGQGLLIETTQRRKDGTFRPVEVSRSFFVFEGREVLFANARDISERRAAESALRFSEEKFSRAFHASPDAINITRVSDGTYLDVSEGFTHLMGWTREESVGHNSLEMGIWADPSDRARMVALLREHGEFTNLEAPFRGKDGRIITGLMSGKRMEVEGEPCLLTFTRDITELRQAEEALRQAQKLESLGVLAGGIAHDFNNLLTAVLGNLNLAQMTLATGNPAEPYLENMERAILKAAELAKQMLAYSGRGQFVVQSQNLNQTVQELTHLLEVSISKKVALHFDLDPDLPSIEADAAQIQQVVMNLVTNAADAIGDREGRIRIRTGRERLDGESLLAAALPGQDLPSGLYVALEVEDTGCGMNREVLDRIFDPFFTTKTTGRGLGLSALLGILRGHNAGLRIASEPGRGSRFQLFFPATSSRLPAPAEPVAEGNPKGLRGRVLVVDDEELILETTAMALSAMGFEVVAARDGLEALARVEADRDGLHLVLMDLTMPRMDGREAFLAMRRLAPDLPVILSSGYNEQDTLQAFGGEGPAAFLQKPYQLRELRRVVQGIVGN
jgi:PAS domain S-box-containing protein